MIQKTCTALEFTFVCPLVNGLHARPASDLANLANDFISSFALTNLRNGLAADVKSVLSIIAADIQRNDECCVRVFGGDEQLAYSALRRFVEEELSKTEAQVAAFSNDTKSRELPRLLRSNLRSRRSRRRSTAAG